MRRIRAAVWETRFLLAPVAAVARKYRIARGTLSRKKAISIGEFNIDEQRQHGVEFVVSTVLVIIHGP